MSTIRKLAAAALIAACAGCTTYEAPPVSEPIAITPQTNAALTSYLRAVRSTRDGAFAVSPDGRNSYYSYCPTLSCAVSNHSVPALRGCQSLSGTRCVLFYAWDDPRLDYTVAESAVPGGRHGSEKQPEIDFERHDRD